MDWLDELLFTTWEQTVALLDLPELQVDEGEDGAAAFESLCEETKAADCIKVGEGEYSVTPRGCQVALLQSQLEVLMSSMDMLRGGGGGEEEEHEDEETADVEASDGA